MNLHIAKSKISQKFSTATEVRTGVFRATREQGSRVLASYVFDLNNQLPTTVGMLSSYLDSVIGQIYFDINSNPDLRWNCYLYFVVKRGDPTDKDFLSTKRAIEADKNYARKFVIFDDEIDRILDELDSVVQINDSVASTDVVQAWSDALCARGLEDVLDENRPVADVVRLISSGTGRNSIRTKKSSGIDVTQQLTASHLASIDLSKYRQYPLRKQFESLGRANLLFGSNGAGKTSLLESIEFLFCGANRRSTTDTHHKVSGILKSGETVETDGKQPLSDFKTRQRIWYGSDDSSRLNTLPNQFARFNFMNTDSAAELSIRRPDAKSGLSSHSESIANLLSGYEASLIWKRIQVINKAISDEYSAKWSERTLVESESQSKKQLLSTLDVAPSQADAKFSIFLKDLQRIVWRELPSNKLAVSTQLEDTLTELASQLQIVRNITWLKVPITENVIRQQFLNLQPVLDGLKNISEEVKEKGKHRDSLLQRKESAENRKKALALFQPEAVTDLINHIQIARRTDAELSEYSTAFSALPSLPVPNSWEVDFAGKNVHVAYHEVNLALDTLRTEASELKVQLHTATSTHSHLQKVMSELQAWARKAIECRSDSDCPVCGTEFEQNELLRRIESRTVANATEELSRINQRIDEVNIQLERGDTHRNWLEQLKRFTEVTQKFSEAEAIIDAVASCEKLEFKKKKLLELKRTSQKVIEGYEKTGLTLHEVEKVCLALDSESTNLSSSLNIVEARNKVEEYLKNLHSKLKAIESIYSEKSAEVTNYLSNLSINSDQPLSSSIETIESRMRLLQGVLSVCENLRVYIDLPETKNLRDLTSSIESAVFGSKAVRSAVKEDESSESQINGLKNRIPKLNSQLKSLDETLRRLKEAKEILADIVENHSLEMASKAVVRATHNTANLIFGRIHSPMEYGITEDLNAPLRTLADKQPVQLNEVSTGQRAAYALSMFLAMNAQMKSGPQVILLDDPISHIDDLNALSFMDYLRNVVLKSNRQVFFATADEKIAGLFAHKFHFLGDNFKVIGLSR